jgi:CheY-like chemotaxis protein
MNAQGKKAILYIDCHADSRAANRSLLAQSGYTVTSGKNTAEAARISTALRYDLLIMDIDSPDCDELELLAEIRRRHPIRGIAISEDGTTPGLDRSAQAGFDVHLVKPIAAAQFLTAVQQTLGNVHEPRRAGGVRNHMSNFGDQPGL